MGIFKRGGDSNSNEPVRMQACMACWDPQSQASMGFKNVEKTDKKGNTISVTVECGSCKGKGEVRSH